MPIQRLTYLDWINSLSNQDIVYKLAYSNIASINQEFINSELKGLELGVAYKQDYNDLTNLIASYFKLETKNIFLDAGASKLNELIMGLGLFSGRYFFVEGPVYQPLSFTAQRFGNEISFKREENYQIDIEKLGWVIKQYKRISEPKLIVITNPHNPSGVYLDENVKNDLVRLVEKNDSYLLCDEVYNYTSDSLFSLSEKVIATNSLTKVYGCGALRLGWSFCNEKIKKDLEALSAYAPCLSMPSVKIATDVFKKIDKVVGRYDKITETNYPIVKAWIASEIKTGSIKNCTLPEKTIMLFPRFGFETDKFVEYLIRQYKTAVVPGSFFGDPYSIRMCFGNISKDDLKTALIRLSLAIHDWEFSL